MSSPVPPEDDLDNVLYFMYNDHTLVSLYETAEQRPVAAGAAPELKGKRFVCVCVFVMNSFVRHAFAYTYMHFLFTLVSRPPSSARLLRVPHLSSRVSVVCVCVCDE